MVPTLTEPYPARKLPVNDPSDTTEPANDNCSVDNGPETNGVAGDKRSGSAGENQPILQI